MSTFKLKPEKVKQITEIHTLDESHKNMMDNFQKKKRLLPRKKNQLVKIKKQLESLEKKPSVYYTNDDIKLKSKLKEELQLVEEDIYDIENNISEMDYYSKIDQVLMDYYDIFDEHDAYYDEHPELSKEKLHNNEHNLDQLDILNKMKKRNVNPQKVPKRRKKRSVVDNKTSIMNFFNNVNNQKLESPDKEIVNSESTCHTNDIIMKENNSEVDRATLLDQYRMLTDNEYIATKNRNINPIRICSTCNVEKTLHHSEATYTCMNCGEVEMIIIEADKPHYTDSSVPEKTGYPYKRVNHLSESITNDCVVIMDIICI